MIRPDTPRVVFHDPGRPPETTTLFMSHLSIETGRFSVADTRHGPDGLVGALADLAPWIAAAEQSLRHGESVPRISTCHLIDDYVVRDSSPHETIATLLAAAGEADVRIDYLARTSGCVRAGEAMPAELVLARLHAEPAPGTNGSRPPTHESGWLSNGERSSSGSGQAMREWGWRPPREFRAQRHSILAEIELFTAEPDPDPALASPRTWASSFLAAVWQLLRLGLLRDVGRPVAAPEPWDPDRLPDRWTELPAVIQLNPEAQPFSAYRILSLLPQQRMPLENAVRMVLGHVIVDREVLDQVREQARAEGVMLPEAVADRMSHVFVDGPVFAEGPDGAGG